MRTFSLARPLVILVLAALVDARIALAQEADKPTQPASESNPAAPAPGHSLHGETFNEGPRQSAVLLEGQGVVDFPVTCASKEVQDFVNQGIAQLHTFYYLEAERSFRQAAKLDPNCVMAYWGMALANTNNPKRAKGFLKEAFAKAALTKITRREQLYLDALNSRHAEGGNDRTRRQNWLQGLEAIVHEFPDDLDARCWMVMVAWENSTSGGGGIGSRQALEEVLRGVENVAPMHPGVHHYRIHLWDGVNHSRAEKSAGLYAEAAPGIAHAWHMPGHTYTGLRRYDDAAYQQEGSARVDHAAMLRDRIMPFEIHNYAHNNQWLATSLSHSGRPREAIRVACNLVEQPRDPKKNQEKDGGSAQRSGRARWFEVLVRYELWDDLIEANRSGALDWSDLPDEQRDRHYGLGLAHAAKGDLSALREDIEALKNLGRRQAPKDEPAPASSSTPVDAPKARPKSESRSRSPNTKAHVAELKAHALRLEGNAGEALKLLADASAMRPEAKARFQVAAGKPDEAEKTIRAAVASHENEVPPLACLVEVLQAAGKELEAKEAYAKLVALRPERDMTVPVYRRLEDIAAAWASSGEWTPPTPPVRGPDHRPRHIDLTKLGPLCWTPYQAGPIDLVDTEGTPWKLENHRGRNVIVLFFLGSQCAHCMQQLQAFAKEYEALKELNTDVVAVSTDGPEATHMLKHNDADIAFPMPILSDEPLTYFKQYRCHDDFESSPLHGTFLIDRDGSVRFQNISADPFLDTEFLKAEIKRINQLLAPQPGAALVNRGCGS